ncbi:MAG: tetratricopeptide repeat protein [Ignavibacteriae bacterium]|nr:tetratricopeptide repeat protein [Ignavibacteriota bacterium]
MKIIIIVFVIIVSSLIIGCGAKHTTEKRYGISFCDSNVLSNVRRSTGAESINGYLTTYTDSVEHVMATIDILNPENYDELVQNNKLTRSIADSIIKSIGYNDIVDSLIINYTDKATLLTFFTEKYTSYSYGTKYIYDIRSIFFKDIEKWASEIQSLIKMNQLERIHLIADSLSSIYSYRYFLFNVIVGVKMRENPRDLTEPKEMMLKEISRRPLNRQIYFYLGYICFLQLQYDESAKYFDKLLRFDPKNIIANYYRGYIYAYAKDYKSAMKQFLLAKESGSDIADKAIEDLHKAGY